MNKIESIALAKQQLYPRIYVFLNIKNYIKSCKNLNKKEIIKKLEIFEYQTKLRIHNGICGIDSNKIPYCQQINKRELK